MKGLIVEEPWLELILSGKKTWEMRKRPWRHRGEIALIRKGSLHVYGVATLVACRGPLTLEELAASERFHRNHKDNQMNSAANGYSVAWVLENARRLPKPIPYHHKNGSQSQVILPPHTESKIKEQLRI